jgi:hypothetical protein
MWAAHSSPASRSAQQSLSGGRHGPPEQALALFRDAVEHWLSRGNQAVMVTTSRNLVILLSRTGPDEAAVALAATLENAAPTKSYGKEAAYRNRARRDTPAARGDGLRPLPDSPRIQDTPAGRRGRSPATQVIPGHQALHSHGDAGSAAG